jgi:hypothetical protein
MPSKISHTKGQSDASHEAGKGLNSKRSSRKWSAKVTKESNAMDLEPAVFKSKSPDKIARSLKKSAQHSDRRKANAFQSAMSMLNFYINRAGSHLSSIQKGVLEAAKGKLRKAFGRGTHSVPKGKGIKKSTRGKS